MGMIVWVVMGVHGLYVDFRFTKKEMIRHHCDTLGCTWDAARAKGDKAVKMWLSDVPPTV
jgi:hypothetical protein